VNLNMIYIYIPTTAKNILTRFNNYRWEVEVLGGHGKPHIFK